MPRLTIPTGYKPILSVYETQVAIGQLKRVFEERLSAALNVKRVSAPLFVEAGSGLNDDLSGAERPVEFDVRETDKRVQIVHSLAKWKRLALYKYGFPIGEGLYTDMNAIRRDEEFDNLHSIYVDQWDWEKVIDAQKRSLEYLRETVTRIVDAVCGTEEALRDLYPALREGSPMSRDVQFITAHELNNRYPNITPQEREDRFTQSAKTACIMQIGLGNRAPDYDDWQLNCDILVWSDILKCAVELSSMGIRVTPQSLDEQLRLANCENRRNLPFHKMLLEGELPLTMGGGIGQSRLSMMILQKAHVGEVQVSVWDEGTREGCKKAGVPLL
ncbi:MAG: aspartate--ammonia ligase [Defluviitaleaceae bacterium]|nr:aspartate--ammonia ligase [Defluviitaleaceae bacterium]